MDQEFLNKLVAPIPGDHPCGKDIAYSQILDEIREARRQDDASLARGEWETELKVAQWPKVKQLCEEILQHTSKDFQVACWYAEALAKLHGFAGVTFGMQVLEVLVNDFWEFFYPSLDLDDLDERAGKIEWLNKQLSLAVRQIPLTSKASGEFQWLQWDESRSVDNLGLKDPVAKERAIASGKLSGEVFDKAVNVSGLKFYQVLFDQVQASSSAVAALEKQIDAHFGIDAPSVKDLRLALRDCQDVVGKLMGKLGGKVETVSDQASSALHANDAIQSASILATAMPVIAIGQIRSRADAVAALRQASQYFKLNEPHSPVAFLADRAAKWADMPFDHWLASVIKDDSTLSQLRELLDIPRDA